MNQGYRFQFTQVDWASWGVHLLIFFGPSLLVFLTAIQSGTPLKAALLVLYAGILGAVIDWLRKYLDGQPKPKV